jgi:ATP-dependent DNA helicase RecG
VRRLASRPPNLEDLLRQRTGEGDRVESKADRTPDAIVETPCAFANEFENPGGDTVVGRDCAAGGRPIFPPVGSEANQLGTVRRERHGDCPLTLPTDFSILGVEKDAGEHLIVLRAPGGLNRP